MQIRNNEITIFRGESFTIHKELRNADNSPYVVGSGLKNPHWLLSISNSLYSQEDRIVLNYWLPVSQTYPINEVIDLLTIKSSSSSNDPVYSSFDEVVNAKVNAVNGYLDGEFVEIPLADVIWQCNGEYKNYVTGKFVDYKCEIAKAFTSSDTDWLPVQTYFYSIQLVSGVNMLDYLKSLCKEYNMPLVNDELTLYNGLLAKGVIFPTNFDVNQALGVIENAYPILPPTKLDIIEYAQGDIL